MSQLDIAKFSFFLWKWIADANNTSALNDAILTAFNSYQNDLTIAKMPFGDPQDFLVGEDILMLSNFSEDEFQKLVGYLNTLKLDFSTNKLKKDLIVRILGISQTFARNRDRWSACEFSKEECEILRGVLEQAPCNYNGLSTKLLSQNNKENQDNLQYYLEQIKKAAQQTANVMKSAAATVYCSAVEYATQNKALSFQSENESPDPKCFILSLERIGSLWRNQTNVSLPNGCASLNVRVIDSVARAFYRDRVLSSDASAGKGQRLGDIKPSNTAQLDDDDRFDDEQYVVFPETVEEAVSASEKNGGLLYADTLKIDREELIQLNYYAINVISPLTESGHALAIYQSLLVLSYADKKRAHDLSSDSVAVASKEMTVSARTVDSSRAPRSQRFNFSEESTATSSLANFCVVDPVPQHQLGNDGF